MCSRQVTTAKRTISHWRAASLIAVYVLMAAHIVHWKLAGKTLVPLELNEVMYTLELGIVTAGFIFMLVAILATAVFGRFFCSWGCHILALQDFSAWILRKLGVRPRPIRSRMLLWVPMLAALYMFAWPQVSRILQGKPPASLHLATDAEGWASFSTDNFWRNLPGPAVIVATFLVCGFVMVYLLGTRSFCAYGCPYGALFGLADRIAPGRIRAGPDCTQCGTCTAVCTSHVRVHEELDRYGMVVNPACMKDLDCVSACPQQTLHYGWGRPSLLRRVLGTKQIKRSFDFAIWEEAVAAVVFVIVLFTYRGLYDLVPFLLTLALGALASYCTLVAMRLLRRRDVTLNRLALRRAGSLTGLGVGFSACMLIIAAFTVHSAFVRYSMFCGERLYTRAVATPNAGADVADRSIRHLALAQSWGLLPLARVEKMLGDLFTKRERWPEAEASRRRLLGRSASNALIQDQLAFTLSKQGRFEEAAQQYRASLATNPNRPEPHFGLASVCFETGRPDLAEQHLRRALQLRPDYVEVLYELGALLVQRGAVGEGIDRLRSCLRLRPEYGDAHYNLAVALATGGAPQDAMAEIERAIALQPKDEQTLRFRDFLVSLLENERRAAGRDVSARGSGG